MKIFLYLIVQCTWGILQSLLGLINFFLHIRDRHYFYHGAVITEWNDKSSVSLGMFVFVTKEPYFYDKLKVEYTKDELLKRLLVHEYGHTVQSLILGPLYLIVIGMPSTLWGFLRTYIKREKMSRFHTFHFLQKDGQIDWVRR